MTLCWRHLISNADLSRSVQEHELTVLDVKKEYTKISSNKCTKTFYRDNLHCIGSFCATVLIYETLESTDEMKLMMKFTCVLLDNILWTLKLAFSLYNLFLVIRWQWFSNCLSDMYVLRTYFIQLVTSCAWV